MNWQSGDAEAVNYANEIMEYLVNEGWAAALAYADSRPIPFSGVEIRKKVEQIEITVGVASPENPFFLR